MILLIILLCTILLNTVYAKNSLEDTITSVEYSEDYKNYLNLNYEEKKQVLEPLIYSIKSQENSSKYLKNINNPLKIFQLLKSTITPSYSLEKIIPENVKIRNQMQTNSCWNFAYIGVLESHLGLRDYLSSKSKTIYDFSEKHMNYSTARSAFKNDVINSYGFSRNLKDGGTLLMCLAYLTNGSGAIPELELPFENSEENIDISEIKNKTISTTLYDANIYPVPNTESEKNNLMNLMKEQISNYGGIYAGIYGAQIISDNYNNQTGAIYCNNSTSTPINHSVTIIGWDDNYDKNNFNEKCRPTNNGAWIIKNSWGSKQISNLLESKNNFYNTYTTECNEKGWHSAEEIPNDALLSSLQKIWGDKVHIDEESNSVSLEIGKNGYMYISYDDANVYKLLSGIQKASSKKDYYNLYQNDILGASNNIMINDSEIYLANVFKRDINIKEAIDKVSIFTFSDQTCEIYINPNNSDKSLSNLQKVKLATGNTNKITPGYHTLEFETPITLTGDTFVIVVKLTNGTNQQYIALESQQTNDLYRNAIVNPNESFFATHSSIYNNEWQDLATLSNTNLRGNACIKAFSTAKIPDTPKPDDDKTNTNPSNKTDTKPSDKNDTNPSDETDTKPSDKNDNNQTNISPTPSKFDKSFAELSNVIYYLYSDNKTSYSTMQIKISNIQLGNEKDDYTYRYYLSGKKGEDISNDKWKNTKLHKDSNGKYYIIIDINTIDLDKNILLSQSDNLYIYIKEISKRDTKTIENIHTFEVKNSRNFNATFYLDDKKVEDLNSIFNVVQNKEGNMNNINNLVDQTTANKVIPSTGIMTLSIFIILILIIAIFSYYRYKKIIK